jgi:hypothetical protein
VVLARVAALCNELRPGSVTPYRGEGEVVVPSPLSPNLLAAFHLLCHVHEYALRTATANQVLP